MNATVCMATEGVVQSRVPGEDAYDTANIPEVCKKGTVTKAGFQ